MKSKDFKNTTTPLDLECLVCKHQWESDYNNISSGRGCPKCGRKRANDSKKIKLDDVINHAKSLGFALFDRDKYEYAKVNTTWICSKGHNFDRSFSKLKLNPLCPICEKMRKQKKRVKKS
ncbi:hypothetical protein [Leptospira sp. GIMC2001]|uniref:hypothetical protein n=1 Tax=Leptospira sp. GIMC2001 TaxID=1513297 RepID=UPI002349DC9B|nr:hypothetical protein [Leptospira sp. GIMC2001]WCL50750.1 hypothetical protein O4O04_08040 [Leptospira sp. GIMC2001]